MNNCPAAMQKYLSGLSCLLRVGELAALKWVDINFSNETVFIQRMDAEGWTLDEIRRWSGHTNKETTLKYLYNPYRASETKNRVKRTSILHTNDSCLQLSSKNEAFLGNKKMPEAL